MKHDHLGALARALTPKREGYALIAVLWVCAGVAILGAGITAAAREAIATSRSRIALAEAECLARGCVARARAAIALRLQNNHAPGFEHAAAVWLRVDSFLHALNVGEACAFAVHPLGAHLDVNAAEEQLLARVFRHAGVPAQSADSAAAALADWKDTDLVPRALGAERDWYMANRLVPPSDRPFADRGEIALVRGMSAAPWQELLDVHPGAIALSHAPAGILAVLPGFSSEAVARVIEMRRRNQPLLAFLEIANGLTTDAANAVLVAVPELAATVSLAPRTWLLEVEARSGNPAVSVVIENWLEQAGSGVHVARDRTWVR